MRDAWNAYDGQLIAESIETKGNLLDTNCDRHPDGTVKSTLIGPAQSYRDWLG